MNRKKLSFDSDFFDTTVTCSIQSDSNKLLTLSAKRSKRSKKSEAELRLADHLKRFESITSVGNVSLTDN